MRKTFVALALALAGSVVAAPGHARDGSMYAAFEGGVFVGQEPKLDVNSTGDAAHLKTNTGWDADVLLGYDFGRFRLEGEGSYKSSNLQQLVAHGAFDIDAVSPGVQATASVSGDIKVQNLMANALYDLGRDGGVNIYAGAGIGYAWTDFDTQIFGVVTPFLDDSASGIAWQGIAGVRVPITSGIELGAKYRYFNVEGLDLVSPTSGSVKTSLRSHSLLASLVFNFG